MTDVHHVFTWDEFLAFLEPMPSPSLGAAHRLRDNGGRRSGQRSEWFGGLTFDQTIERARGEGYAEALPEVEQLVAQVEKQVEADLNHTTFEARYEVAGAEVDMGRFLSGEPECMVESAPIRIARKGRAVRIVVPVNYSAVVPAETVRARGAAVVALCDILSRAQHPLEVWASIANTSHHRDRKTGNYPRYATSVLVQAADQPLDMGRIMLALAHPAMLRRLGFACEEQESDAIRKSFGYHEGSGYGGPTFEARATDLPDQHGETIVLPYLSGQTGWDPADAIRWIEQQLDNLFKEVS